MAELKIQTGWGAELSADAQDCLQLIREAASVLRSLNLDPALEADRNIQSSLLKLMKSLEETENRVDRISAFLESGLRTYESLERELTEEARKLGSGVFLPEVTDSTSHLRSLFEENSKNSNRSEKKEEE